MERMTVFTITTTKTTTKSVSEVKVALSSPIVVFGRYITVSFRIIRCCTLLSIPGFLTFRVQQQQCSGDNYSLSSLNDYNRIYFWKGRSVLHDINDTSDNNTIPLNNTDNIITNLKNRREELVDDNSNHDNTNNDTNNEYE